MLMKNFDYMPLNLFFSDPNNRGAESTRVRDRPFGEIFFLQKFLLLSVGEIFPPVEEIFYFSGRFCTSAK